MKGKVASFFSFLTPSSHTVSYLLFNSIANITNSEYRVFPPTFILQPEILGDEIIHHVLVAFVLEDEVGG